MSQASNYGADKSTRAWAVEPCQTDIWFAYSGLDGMLVQRREQNNLLQRAVPPSGFPAVAGATTSSGLDWARAPHDDKAFGTPKSGSFRFPLEPRLERKWGTPPKEGTKKASLMLSLPKNGQQLASKKHKKATMRCEDSEVSHPDRGACELHLRLADRGLAEVRSTLVDFGRFGRFGAGCLWCFRWSLRQSLCFSGLKGPQTCRCGSSLCTYC